MVRSIFRIGVSLTFLALILLLFSHLSPESSWRSQLTPNYINNQNFVFSNQFFTFRLEGTYSNANWTLYQHDIVSNTSYILINTTQYLEIVTLALPTGLYSLQVILEADLPITVICRAYGVSTPYIQLIVVCFSLSLGISIVGLVQRYYRLKK